MATSIRETLIDNRIVCHYQPIFKRYKNKIKSINETLVRWLIKRWKSYTSNGF